MTTETDRPEYFTIVFDGRLRDIKNNPFNVESPFGKVVAVGVGDALGRQELIIDLTNVAIQARQLADSCIEDGRDEFTTDGLDSVSVPDLVADLSCAINKAHGA